MEDLFLVYINVVGKEWKGGKRYEFLFSDDITNIDGDDWDSMPAAGKPLPPYEDLIKKSGSVVMEEKDFHVIQESELFSVFDAVDGVIALAWENMTDYVEYPESRIAFHFGETIKSIEDKLYEQDLTLEYKTETNGKLKTNNEDN